MKKNGFVPVVVLLLIVAVAAGVVVTKRAVENSHILGLSSLLAENGDGTGPAPAPAGGGDSGGGGSQPQPQQQQQPSQSSGSQPSNPNPGTPQKDNRPVNQQNGSTQQNPRPGTPQDNNKPLNQQNFGTQQNPNPGTPQGDSRPKFVPTSIQGSFNVGTKGDSGQQVNLNDGNTKFTFGSFKAVKPDGTEFEINKDEAEKINAAIKLETGSEISQNGKTFTVKRGDVSAKTDFPISFNVATKTFTVQTPNGEKEIAVLPDQAVAKIQEANTNFTADSEGVKLTELNNEPVFEVPGTTQQKFLGFIPVGIQQTSVVSADSGEVVSTNQNPVFRILDVFSF